MTVTFTIPSILFVCTANQFRSPLAAAFLLNAIKQRGNEADWLVESAGTWTNDGIPVLLLTQKIAKGMGLRGLEKHFTRQVNAELLEKFDLIVVMESGHKEALSAEFKSARSRVYMLSEVVDESQYAIPDPVIPGVQPDAVAAELRTIIERGFDKILAQAQAIHTLRTK